MNTLSEETPRVKSGESAGGKNRRDSIGIKTSGKSSGEEVNSVPNYLKASTISCHDLCKYGKNHEHVKSAIPIKFKRSMVVDKEKVAKAEFPVKKKKTTTVAKFNPSADPKFPKPAEPFEESKKDAALASKKTSHVMKRSLSTNRRAIRKAQVMKRSLSRNGKAARNEPKMFQRSTSLIEPSPVTVHRDASAGSNAGIKKKDIQTVKKAEATPKTGPAMKYIPKATLTDSRSQKTPRVKSSGSAGSKGGKNRRHSIGITTSEKSSGEEVNSVPNYLRASTGSCHDFCKYGKHHEHIKSAFTIKFKRTTDKEKVAKTVVSVQKKKTTTVKPSPVMVKRDVSAGSNAGIKKKEIKTVKKAEAAPKTGPAKNRIPTATLTDSRSQKASFSRAESLKATKSKIAKKVAPLKHQNQMQKSEPKQTSSDKVQKLALQDGKTESEVNIDFIHPSIELVNPPVCNESEPFSCNDIGEEESLITHTVYESSVLFLDEELPENSTIMPTVIESTQSSSNEDVLEEDSSIYENSEVFPDRELLEESAIRATVEGTESTSGNEVFDENPLIAHTAYLSYELILDEESSIAPTAVVGLQSSSDKHDLGEDSMITHLVHESSELFPYKELIDESSIAPRVAERSHSFSDKEVSEEGSLIAPPVSKSTQDEGVLEDESEYTDDHNEEVEVSEDVSESSDNEKEVAAAPNDETETIAGVEDKVRRKGRWVISKDKDDKGVKLKFRREKVLDIQSENNDSKNGRKSVVLKHQGMQEKKYAQGLLNNIIEEIASKFAESGKSKVKALVGAFETMIYLSKTANRLPHNEENGHFFHY